MSGEPSPEQGLSAFMHAGQVGPDRPRPQIRTEYGKAEPLTQKLEKSGDISSSIAASRRTTDLLVPPGAGGKKEPEKDPNREGAIQSSLLRGESLKMELIATAEDPVELIYGLREFEAKLEDGSVPRSLEDSYTSTRVLDTLFERERNLRVTVDELKRRGWVKERPDGKVEPKNHKFAGFAVSANQEPVKIQGQVVGYEADYDFGAPDKRLELANAYLVATREFESRNIMGEHLGVRLSLDYRDALENLVDAMHGRAPIFKAEHLTALFNLPGLKEAETTKSPENHALGDQIEESMLAYLIMLNSGTKQKMEDFLKRPGVDKLIERINVRQSKTSGGISLTTEAWKLKYVGDVDNWVDDKDRRLDTYRDDRKDPTKPGRGLLTRWSNLASFEGDPGEFNARNEKEFIEKTIGGAVGSVEASWIAATFLRVMGAYASEGYVALPNGQSSLKLGEGRYISSDDTGKFWAYMWNIKEGLKGRKTGLKDMIGRIPDTAMNLFDWGQVVVGVNASGKPIVRSIMDAWLGTPGGLPIKNLLTGKDTGHATTEEDYHRLGDIKFDTMDLEFHQRYALMQWLLGRQNDGVLINAMKTDLKFEDFSLDQLKSIWKYIGITFNPIILTKGSPHIYQIEDDVRDNTGKITKPGTILAIQRNFFHNLMVARMRSVSFKTGILPQEITVYDPAWNKNSQKKVSAMGVIDLSIRAVEDDDPRTEEQLVQNYMDDNDKLEKAPLIAEANNYMKKWNFVDEVGRVTGKTKNGKLVF